MKHALTTIAVFLFFITAIEAQPRIDSVGSAAQQSVLDGLTGFGPKRAYPVAETNIKFFDGRACTLYVYEEYVYVDHVTGEIIDTVRSPVMYYDMQTRQTVDDGYFVYDGDPAIQRIWIIGYDDYARLRLLTREQQFPATKIHVSW